MRLDFRKKNKRDPRPIKSVSGALWRSKVVRVINNKELLMLTERRKNLAQ